MLVVDELVDFTPAFHYVAFKRTLIVGQFFLNRINPADQLMIVLRVFYLAGFVASE